MQGVFLFGRRPKSKAEIRRFLSQEAPDLFGLVIEATSIHDDEYDGSLHNADKRETFWVVGPDPRNKRAFYGVISYSSTKERWVIQ